MKVLICCLGPYFEASTALCEVREGPEELRDARQGAWEVHPHRREPRILGP